MTAYDKGVRRGKAFLQQCPVEMLNTMTLDEFCRLGAVDAIQRYQRSNARQDFVLAWRSVGEAFAVLFKPGCDENRVASDILGALQSALRRATEYLERLRDWEPPTDYMKLLIDDARENVAVSIEDISDILGQLRETKGQG